MERSTAFAAISPSGRLIECRDEEEAARVREWAEWCRRKREEPPRTEKPVLAFNRLITYDGRTQCLAAWAEEVGFPANSVGFRLNRLGWPVGRALTEPLQRGRRRVER